MRRPIPEFRDSRPNRSPRTVARVGPTRSPLESRAEPLNAVRPTSEVRVHCPARVAGPASASAIAMQIRMGSPWLTHFEVDPAGGRVLIALQDPVIAGMRQIADDRRVD